MDLIFDGDCSICQASVRWIERHDPANVIDAVASEGLSAHDALDLPVATTVVVRTKDGRVLLRSAAIVAVLSTLPGWPGSVGRVGRSLLRWPLLRSLADGAYRLVAANRHTISATLVRVGVLEESCRVPRVVRRP